EALIHLANAALEGTLPMTIPGDVEQAMKTLQTFPGIGRWTANYFALRGWQAKDVFLPDDYLIKQRFPGMTPAQIRRYAERWKPWRSYALLHIWYTEGWQPDEA
ncbi:DNA-3-methyladenine glycosylase 2, partial [Escherichia coli]|nr:DNA-3-methyladenine glycosylase 2 [Escherichia coli]EEY2765015.1 DNA-3-methyladenine glycosylase 2 [Escherichia coli]